MVRHLDPERYHQLVSPPDDDRESSLASSGQGIHDSLKPRLYLRANAATEKNLKGLIVNRERCFTFIHDSVALATLLNPTIGYMKAAEIAKESEKSGQPVRDIVAQHNIMSREEFDALVLKAARDGKV